MKKLMSMFGVISFLFALVLSSCGGADEVATDEVATDEVATEEVANEEVANEEVATEEVSETDDEDSAE